MVAPTNTSEVQWKTNGLNPLSLREAQTNACGRSGAQL